MALNLSTLAASKEHFDVELLHPVTGEKLEDAGKPVSITILNKASKEYRNTQAAQLNARLKSSARGPLTVEKINEDATALLVAVTVGANGLEYKGSETIDFKELYNDPEMAWLKDQVGNALEDAANFLAA